MHLRHSKTAKYLQPISWVLTLLFMPLIGYLCIVQDTEYGIELSNYYKYDGFIFPYRDYKILKLTSDLENNAKIIDSVKTTLHILSSSNDTTKGVVFKLGNCQYKDFIDVLTIALNEKLDYVYNNNTLAIFNYRKRETKEWFESYLEPPANK
jgi:hypothetical protein